MYTGDGMPVVNEIEVTELHELINNTQKRIEIYDVRSTHEMSNGTIPEAQHMPLHTIPSKVIDLTDKYPIVLYCYMGTRSVQACRYLQNAGFENVFTLRGGFQAWQSSGLLDLDV